MVIKLDRINHSTYYGNKINTQPQFGNNTKSQNEIPTTTENKNKILIPVGTIAAGTILLYLGLKNFTKKGKLKNYVNEKFAFIDSKISEFNTLVKQTINEHFPDVTLQIKDFKNKRFLHTTQSVREIKSSENLSQLIENQDHAFELIEKHNNQFNKGGATPYDKFRTDIEKIRRQVWAKVAPKRDELQMQFNDIANIPDFSDNSHSKLTKLTREILNNKKDKTINRINNSTDTKLANIVKMYSTEMADTIVELRSQQKSTKEKFIDSAFKRVNELLGNSKKEILKPTYSTTPTLENFSKLTTEELKPTSVPQELIKTFENNTYFQAILEKDFNEIDTEDIKQIFYHSPYENNLNDLRFLIDRLRLRQAIEKVQNPENEKTYTTIIAKLEYLANKLKTFGEDELIKRCSKDFSNMTSEQKKVALYNISTVSRHLGYESIIKMDDELSKTNQAYKNSNIRKSMWIFKQNPDFYFV